MDEIVGDARALEGFVESFAGKHVTRPNVESCLHEDRVYPTAPSESTDLPTVGEEPSGEQPADEAGDAGHENRASNRPQVSLEINDAHGAWEMKAIKNHTAT